MPDKIQGKSANNISRRQAAFWSEFLKRDISFLSRYAESRRKDSYFPGLFEMDEEYVEPLRDGNVLKIGYGNRMDSFALDYDCQVMALDIFKVRVELALVNI